MFDCSSPGRSAYPLRLAKRWRPGMIRRDAEGGIDRRVLCGWYWHIGSDVILTRAKAVRPQCPCVVRQVAGPGRNRSPYSMNHAAAQRLRACRHDRRRAR